jgi:hypothetical protein
MNEQARKDNIVALIEERRGWQLKGRADRVADVDAELRRLGHEAAAPVVRAERRTRKET